MAKGTGSDKGKKLRAERARAAAEKVAEAQAVPGAGDSKIGKRQNEDSDDGEVAKKKQKQTKQTARKAEEGYRNPGGDKLRVKQTAKKALGLLPKQGFQGMDTEPDSKEDDGDYNPDEAEEIGTEQEDHKQQSGNRQNSVDNQQIVPYRLPDPFEGYASEVRPFYNLHMTAGH
jgi:hypothetical protein